MSHTRYPSSDNELVLYRVLQRANLLQYYEAFISQGGDDVNQLCEAGEDEFLEIMALVGMASKPLHVRRLQKALLEWIVEPAMFCKPLQDRRVSPAMVSKGSIYAAVQQDPMGVSRVLNGNNGGTVGPPAARHDTLPFNHRATPNSDDTSDPDGLSNTSFDTSIAVMRSSGVSTPTFNSVSSSLLSDEQVAVLAAAADSMSKSLPPYAPKPLNMKKAIDKEIQEAMTCLEEDPSRLDVSRRYSAIYGRFDSKRPPHKHMNFHEVCVNEAAAHLCRHRPSLLTRRDDLFNLALRIVKETGFQSLRTGPIISSYSGSFTSLCSPAPPAKQPRIESPSIPSSNNSSKPTTQSGLLTTEEPESLDNSGCSVVDASSSDHIVLDSEPPSLVDEGLRIARQYGLGADFESELEGIKKATTAAASQEVPATVAEETEGSAPSSSVQNHGSAMADHDARMADHDARMEDHDVGMEDHAAATADVDQVQMIT